jgi:predicted RNase H-like HicB family nuclease
MVVRLVLSDYIAEAVRLASFKQLEDGSFAGRVEPCPGLLAFAEPLDECRQELRSVLEEWIVLGLKLGHELPVISTGAPSPPGPSLCRFGGRRQSIH